MKISNQIHPYTIRDIINYRSLSWLESEDFLYLTEISLNFEPFFIKPDHYCFGMLSDGIMEVNINGELHELTTNSIMIYRPDQVFKVTKLTEGTRGVFVLFNKKFLNNLNENIFSIKSNSFLSQGTQTVIELREEDRIKTLTTFKEIFSLLGHLSKTKWELIARNLTSALIYETDNILEAYIDDRKISSNADMDLYTRFNDLIVSNFNTNRGLSFYASELCVSMDTLRNAVKIICGKTPVELISRQVITEAKYLAGYTLMSCAEIAEELNFSDQFSFSKYFKKHSGYSPMHYRKHADVATA